MAALREAQDCWVDGGDYPPSGGNAMIDCADCGAGLYFPPSQARRAINQSKSLSKNPDGLYLKSRPFLLVPRSLGLAPAAPGGGASYCLATRRHGGHILPVLLDAAEDLSRVDLTVFSYGRASAFLAEIGEYPIEKLAQEDFPNTVGTHWHSILRLDFTAETWDQIGRGDSVVVANQALVSRVNLRHGVSYFLGARTELGSKVSAVLQCFLVSKSPKVLMAWRLLRVHGDDPSMPQVLPWWRPAAWRNLVRNTSNIEEEQERRLPEV